jgi:hypothetical protein
MAFDWLLFLDRYGIEYADSGPNVGKDHVVTHCPYCGSSDQSMHMSISTEGKGWHCWRDNSHAGISPTRLVAAMLNISWSDAAAITGTGKGYQSQPPVQAELLVEQVNNLLQAPTTRTAQPKLIEFPQSAQPLNTLSRTAIPYQLYMRGRGITDLNHLDRWDILYDHRDERFHGRILFGVRDKGKLVALTARAVGQRLQPRYLAEGPVDQHLIWADRFPTKSNTLVLCEGPFDALKLNLLGKPYGIWATCCMTSSFSDTQRSKLYSLMPRFKRTVALFDRGNEHNAHRLSQGFPGRMLVGTLPPNVKDPAELDNIDFLIEPHRAEDDCD